MYKYVLQDGSKSIKIYQNLLYYTSHLDSHWLGEMNIQTLHGKHGSPPGNCHFPSVASLDATVYRLYRPRQPINQVLLL
jgi:hypothetical protein